MIIACRTKDCKRAAVVRAYIRTEKLTKTGKVFGQELQAYCRPCSKVVEADAITSFENLTSAGTTRTLTVAQWVAERQAERVPHA